MVLEAFSDSALLAEAKLMFVRSLADSTVQVPTEGHGSPWQSVRLLSRG
jgi:hypothetical protein